MEFQSPLFAGKILKRYKRFLADIELSDGQRITAHTSNTGSMKTCWDVGWKVLVSYHNSPKRKLKYSLEMTHNGDTWIGVNTSLPNRLAKEAIENQLIPEFQGYDNVQAEKKIGDSRIDLYLSGKKKGKALEECYIEIKNVTLLAEKRAALFPDAVSTRGQKHLKELIQLKKRGVRAAMLYIVQRQDVDHFRPAWDIDPTYAELVQQAKEVGVEILAYQCELSPKGVKLKRPLPCFIESTSQL